MTTKQVDPTDVIRFNETVWAISKEARDLIRDRVKAMEVKTEAQRPILEGRVVLYMFQRHFQLLFAAGEISQKQLEGALAAEVPAAPSVGEEQA